MKSNVFKKKDWKNLTKDESYGSTFPTTQIHDGVMNAINERSFTKVVEALVVAVTAVGVGSMVGMTVFIRSRDSNDFNVSYHIFAVDRCKSVGSADKR
jgi:hypothetical protein